MKNAVARLGQTPFLQGESRRRSEPRSPCANGHEIEIQTENKKVEVSSGDGALEPEAELGAAIPPSPFGFHVPANNAVEFRDFAMAGEARTPRGSIVSCPAYANGAETPGRIGPWQGRNGDLYFIMEP